MGDPKTTIAGAVAAIASVLAIFNVVIPQELSEVIIAIAVFAIGYFAKDKVAK